MLRQHRDALMTCAETFRTTRWCTPCVLTLNAHPACPLQVLRQHRDALMTCAETFLHDPLVEWVADRGRKGAGAQVRAGRVWAGHAA